VAAQPLACLHPIQIALGVLFSVLPHSLKGSFTSTTKSVLKTKNILQESKLPYSAAGVQRRQRDMTWAQGSDKGVSPTKLIRASRECTGSSSKHKMALEVTRDQEVHTGTSWLMSQGLGAGVAMLPGQQHLPGDWNPAHRRLPLTAAQTRAPSTECQHTLPRSHRAGGIRRTPSQRRKQGPGKGGDWPKVTWPVGKRKPRSMGGLQLGEQREASSYKRATPMWPQPFQNRKKLSNVSSQRVPSLGHDSLQQLSRQAGLGLLKLPRSCPAESLHLAPDLTFRVLP
jgi:hypothetical protein